MLPVHPSAMCKLQGGLQSRQHAEEDHIHRWPSNANASSSCGAWPSSLWCSEKRTIHAPFLRHVWPCKLSSLQIPKLLAHRLFPNAQFSIWVDAKLELRVDPYKLLERWD